ncbi:hypothetical protein D3C84_812570 [compost metagenome]
MSWITPLFWAKVTIGMLLNTAAMAELRPSASRPDLIRRMYTGPLTGCREIIELAVRSPAASNGETRKITATGMNATQSKEKPYLNGTGTLISGTSGRPLKSTWPMSQATP